MVRVKLCLVIAILCLATLLAGACKSEPAPTPVSEVKDAADARDVGFSYLQEQEGQDVPGADAEWQEADVTPPGLVGSTTKEFTSDGWTVEVYSPVVAPQYIRYEVTITSVQMGWHWQGTVKPDGTVTEVSAVTQMSKEGSQAIAEEFVRGSPTFAFDGMEETLKLTETLTARCPFCWSFTFEFDSRQAGYGDRTGKMLAQVITHHRAAIMVEQMEITSAVIDEKWDMLRQREVK